jgi:hypothetical protein
MSDPMDQFNRFLVVTAALLVTFTALVIVTLAWGAPGSTIDRVTDFAGWLRDHNDRETKVILTLVSAVVVLLMLMAIIVELTPSPTQKMRVRNVKSGDAAITTKQIAERINAEVVQMEHVAECQAIVAARGKRVEVVLELHVDPGADLSRTADEACRRAQTLVEQQLGIELAQRPRARLHYRELRLRGEPQPPQRSQQPTGWERPAETPEGERDQRGQPDAPEEAQA